MLAPIFGDRPGFWSVRVLTDGANMLERLYPYPYQKTASGLGEAKEFQSAFLQVHYRQVVPRAPLPFAEKSFDIATSNAVLEHAGGVEDQRQFVAEMARVIRRTLLAPRASIS